jgi:S-methyl-5-thioribulose 1-phosphate isomerase
VSDGRLRVVYEWRPARGEDPRGRAADMAREQSLELPPGCAPAAVEERFLGRVEAVETVGRGRARATVSFDLALPGGEAGQLLDLLYGHLSMQGDVRIAGVEWPVALLERFPGPRHGLAGFRDRCGVGPERPLLCAALKPPGLTPAELAERAHELAAGGIDLLKDDHGLADQEMAPFAERVARCQEAVARANAATGGRTVYLPHLTGPAVAARAAAARRLGCEGALVTPLIVGLDTLTGLAADDTGLLLMTHPSLMGALAGPRRGIAPEVLLGEVFRLAGADAVLYPNVGGRFRVSASTCLAIHRRLRAPLGRVRPAMPALGGGIDPARLPRWVRRYGPDTVFLVGGGLYRQGDLRRAAARLREAVERGPRR